VEESLRIFLCYAREDEIQVSELYARLSVAGYRPWMDKMDLLPGVPWEQGIEDSIRQADLFLACLSSRSVKKRGFIQREIDSALAILREKLAEDIYLIPVRLDDCEIPKSLNKLTWVDFFQESGWQRLEKSIELMAKRRAEIPIIAIDESPQSPFLWDLELQKLLTGERRLVVTRLGSLEEYIELTLSLSQEREASQASFRIALCKQIERWSPSKQHSLEYVGCLLDLIHSYTPVSGDEKILELLKAEKPLGGGETRADYFEWAQDIYRKALHALERYFPDSFPAQARAPYVNILLRLLDYPRHCGYAVRRLMELGEIVVSGQQVSDLIQVHPQCIREIASVLLNPARRPQIGREMAHLYAACLLSTPGAQIHFEQSLGALGASLEHSTQGPIIVIDDQMYPLDLPDAALNLYMQERWDRGAKQGIEKLLSMMGREPVDR
jgi:hypothetical protein